MTFQHSFLYLVKLLLIQVPKKRSERRKIRAAKQGIHLAL